MSLRKLVGIITLVGGILFAAVGLLGVGLYVWYVIASVGQPDRSGLFWFLPALLYGLPLFLLGLAVAFAGLRSYRGHHMAYKISLLFLTLAASLIIVAIPLVYFRLQQVQQADQDLLRQKENAAQSQRYLQQRHKLLSVVVTSNGREGVDVAVSTTGGLAGTYVLESAVSSAGTEYYRAGTPLTLGQQSFATTTRVTYAQLFAVCSDPARNQYAYVCVPNTGTSSTSFDVAYTLRLVRDAQGQTYAAGAETATTASTSFTIDTRNRDGAIEVSNFKSS